MVNAPSQIPSLYFESLYNDDWGTSPPSSVGESDDWTAGPAVVKKVRTARRIRYTGRGRRLYVDDLLSQTGIRYAISDPQPPSSADELRHRLDNANRHFRRKAAAVLADEIAVRLLAELYESFNLDLEEFDACKHGVALAKLTAANFSEVGPKVIYITEAGQGFIEALNKE